MKTTLAAVVILLLIGTSWVSAQMSRGNPKIGQGVYEQQCFVAMDPNWTGTAPTAKT